jgi:hypothetical protein
MFAPLIRVGSAKKMMLISGWLLLVARGPWNAWWRLLVRSALDSRFIWVRDRSFQVPSPVSGIRVRASAKSLARAFGFSLSALARVCHCLCPTKNRVRKGRRCVSARREGKSRLADMTFLTLRLPWYLCHSPASKPEQDVRLSAEQSKNELQPSQPARFAQDPRFRWSCFATG